MSEREALVARLPELMRSLYETGAYFVSIPPGADTQFEEGYWHEIVDPDGIRRDRLAEREQSLRDLGAELAFVHSLKPGRILDAGCGLGWFLSALDDGWDRHGLELSRFAAEHARQFGDVRTVPIENCDYPDDFFDVVFCHHVIEHLPDPLRGLEQLRRILKPAGKLILGTPDFDSGAARRYRAGYRLVRDPTHISLFSNDSLHRFLRDNAFHIDYVDYPFFDTRHFTKETLLRLFDVATTSPAFYGNFMSFYCTRA